MYRVAPPYLTVFSCRDLAAHMNTPARRQKHVCALTLIAYVVALATHDNTIKLLPAT